MALTPADLFLSPDPGHEQVQSHLQAIGFREPAVADQHLRALADDPSVREALAEVAEPLLEALSRAPDPDAALVGFSRYLAARGSKVMFLHYLHDDEPALGVLIEILGTSPFLTETLIRNPEYLERLVAPQGKSPGEAP